VAAQIALGRPVFAGQNKRAWELARAGFGLMRSQTSEQAMYLVQILLPCADNSGKAFPQKDFEQVKAGLAERFEGVTAYLQAPAEGLWRKGRRLAPDDIIIFEVMTDELDLAEWRNDVSGMKHTSDKSA
jgi:hypothetical protein